MADKTPKILRSVMTPMQIIFAGNDEYRDRPIKIIAKWFAETLADKPTEIKIIYGSAHNFKDHEESLKKMINTWKSGLID